MKKIRLGLFEKSVETKISDGKEIAPLMIADGNAQVHAHGNSLNDSSTFLQNKDIARAQAKALAKSKTEELNTEETSFDNVIRAAAAEVMIQYPNNVSKWEALGFEVSDDVTPQQPPVQIESLSVTIGDFSGVADLSWDGQKNLAGYKIQMIDVEPTTPGAVWMPATPDFATKSKVSVTGLTPAKRYWFRVIAVNTAGAGAPSDPVSKVIS